MYGYIRLLYLVNIIFYLVIFKIFNFDYVCTSFLLFCFSNTGFKVVNLSWGFEFNII
jgi:hypothetical protein